MSNVRWIPWVGDGYPVEVAPHTLVEIMVQDGGRMIGPARAFTWEAGHLSTVVAYRVMGPAAEMSEPVWKEVFAIGYRRCALDHGMVPPTGTSITRAADEIFSALRRNRDAEQRG